MKYAFRFVSTTKRDEKIFAKLCKMEVDALDICTYDDINLKVSVDNFFFMRRLYILYFGFEAEIQLWLSRAGLELRIGYGSLMSFIQVFLCISFFKYNQIAPYIFSLNVNLIHVFSLS